MHRIEFWSITWADRGDGATVIVNERIFLMAIRFWIQLRKFVCFIAVVMCAGLKLILKWYIRS